MLCTLNGILGNTDSHCVHSPNAWPTSEAWSTDWCQPPFLAQVSDSPFCREYNHIYLEIALWLHVPVSLISFWNNPTRELQVFTQCSSQLRAQAPESRAV